MSSLPKTDKKKSVWKKCSQRVFRFLFSRKKKPIDQTKAEIVELKSPCEKSAAEIHRCILPCEIKKIVSSVSDEGVSGPLTEKAITSSGQNSQQMNVIDEAITVPVDVHGHCTNKNQLVKLRRKVRRLTDVVNAVDVHLGRIIAELHEFEDKTYGAPRINDKNNDIVHTEPNNVNGDENDDTVYIEPNDINGDGNDDTVHIEPNDVNGDENVHVTEI